MTERSRPQNPAEIAHPCRLVSEQHGPIRVVKVVGCLDWATVGRFRELLDDECTDPAIVIDLGDTKHIDGAGTGMLVAATVLARNRGQQLVIVTADPVEREVLDYTGLSGVVPVVASQADALERIVDHSPSTAAAGLVRGARTDRAVGDNVASTPAG